MAERTPVDTERLRHVDARADRVARSGGMVPRSSPRARQLTALQGSRGNAYVQRLLRSAAASPELQRTPRGFDSPERARMPQGSPAERWRFLADQQACMTQEAFSVWAMKQGFRNQLTERELAEFARPQIEQFRAELQAMQRHGDEIVIDKKGRYGKRRDVDRRNVREQVRAEMGAVVHGNFAAAAVFHATGDVNAAALAGNLFGLAGTSAETRNKRAASR